MRTTDKSMTGFTLIELMIAGAIAAVLAVVAYPNYVEHMRKTRRSDAKTAVLRAAQVLERCYTEFNAYNNTGCPAVDNSDNTSLATAYTASDEGHYTVSALSLTTTSFNLQAAPTGVQSSDKCGNLSYNHIGVKGVSADVDGDGTAGDADDVATCW